MRSGFPGNHNCIDTNIFFAKVVGVVFSGGNVIENLDLSQVALLPCQLEQPGQAVQGGGGATSLQ